MASLSVSVVIPLYEGRELVTEALDSVAAQTSPPHEVIVVDDGSTDGGAEVARAHPLAPRVLRQANRGPAAARNAGVAVATGDLIALLDADDLWVPDKLARQVEAFRLRPEIGWAFGHHEVVGPDGRPIPSAPPRSRAPTLRDLLTRGNQVGTLTVVARRAAWEAAGWMPEDRCLVGAEDFALWLRFARRYPLHYDAAVLARQRLHATNTLGADWRRAFQSEARVVARFFASEPEVARELFCMPPAIFRRVRPPLVLSRWLGGARRLRPSTWPALLRAWAETGRCACPAVARP